MLIIESTNTLRQAVANLRATSGKDLALVPTMGALHQGHLSLVQQAKADGCVVVVSIFVNPTQFAANEDLDSYPSTLDADLAHLRTVGVDAVWTPTRATMYPGSDHTRVRLDGDIAQRWEGAFRPHFFQGVATVVAKLFTAVQPDKAYFGEKDFQQLKIITAMAQDLLMPVQVIGCPTVREPSGLAMSSRNSYLDDGEIQIAAKLNECMQAMAADIRGGRGDPKQCASQAITNLVKSGFATVDYLAAVQADSLAPIETYNPNTQTRILAAAYLGSTRLIDNIAV